MRALKWISILTAFLLMFTVIPATVAEDGIILDAGKDEEEALEIEMDGVSSDGLEAIDDLSHSLEDVVIELGGAEDVQLISEIEAQTEKQKKSNDSSDFDINKDGKLIRYRGFDKNVIIPNGVTSIGYSAFMEATFVESISIPSSVTSIGSMAFWGCDNLKSVSIPDSVNEVDSYAFSQCKALTSVHLSGSLKTMTKSVFSCCDSLESIILPNSITEIEEEAFGYCDNLESITIPASVISIDRDAFSNSDKVIIRGTAGSYAEYFANAVGIPFNAPMLSIDEPLLSKYHNDYILYINQSCTLTAIQKPADLAQTLRWTSSDTSIATVDQDGTVKGVSQGTVTITANTADGRGKASQISIIVPEPTKIELSYNYGSNKTIILNQTSLLRASRSIPYQYITDVEMPINWSSSDNSVISVESTENGMATLKGNKLGKATITATTPDSGNASVEIEVIRPDAVSIKIDQSGPIRLFPGQKCALSTTIAPAEAAPKLTWNSWNIKIATVNQNGVVTAVKPGDTSIYVETDNDLDASIDIHVLTPPKKIALSQSKATLAVGDKLTLKATVTPNDAETGLTWSSSKPSVATVTPKGKVTALKTGTAKITVKTDNGKKASATITVKPAPTKVKLSKTKATLGVREKLQLKASVSPTNAFTALTWKSSRPAVAAVSKQGVVTPKKPGTAVIMVRTHNGKTAKATVTVKAAPKKVTLNKSGTVELKKGKRLKLKATLPKDTASTLTWTSSKPKVASVDQKGNVRALKKGTAVITVKTFNGKTAKVTVTVK